MAAKKSTKAAAAKEETKVEDVVTEVTEEAKTAKKPAAKKAAKAKEPKFNVTIEYLEKNITVDELIEAVKEAYKANGNVDAIETVDVYYQPENNKVYYVVNGEAQEEPVNV